MRGHRPLSRGKAFVEWLRKLSRGMNRNALPLRWVFNKNRLSQYILRPELGLSRQADGSGSDHPALAIVVFDPDVTLCGVISLVLLRHRSAQMDITIR